MIDVLGISTMAQGVAQALMVDTCIARRPTGTETVNQSTGAVTAGFTDLFTDQCRLRHALSRHPETDIAESQVTTTQLLLVLPANRDSLQVNDVVEILTSQSPGNVGRKVRVAAPWLQTSSSSCRYPVTESTIPDMP